MPPGKKVLLINMKNRTRNYRCDTKWYCIDVSSTFKLREVYALNGFISTLSLVQYEMSLNKGRDSNMK